MKKKKLLEKAARDVAKTTKSKKENEVFALEVKGISAVLDDGKKLVYLTTAGEIVEKIVIDGTTYTPPPKNNLPYLFPNKDLVLSLTKDGCDRSDSVKDTLYTLLRKYHENLSDLPNPLYYDLLVLWDMHTYFLEKLHFSPILYLYATKERGKSRTGKGCIFVSKRGVFTETVREPDIIRWANDHQATIGFDVKDFPRKIQRANCDDLILARFERGSTSSRTLWPEKGPFQDTKTFSLYGPTIVMTNRPLDDVLESRSIAIDMKPSSKKFNLPVIAENALELKARLTAFKFLNQNKKIIKAEKPADGRLGDILSPLYSMVLTFFPKKKKTFFKLVELIISQKKDSATDTFEAQIVETVAGASKQVVDGFLSVELITSLFNEGKNENFAIRSETIGRILKGLGFSSRRAAGGKRGIYYDLELIENLKYQYGLEGVPTTLSLLSQPPTEATPSGTKTDEEQSSWLETNDIRESEVEEV